MCTYQVEGRVFKLGCGKPLPSATNDQLQIDIDLFWQCIFATMIDLELPVDSRCAACGEKLPPTKKTGRECERTFCKKCAHKEWVKQQLADPEKKSKYLEAQRKKQKAYRERQRTHQKGK